MTSLRSRVAAVAPDPAVVRQALALALAAWLSFALASALHVANAYWAAMPVWVLAQASRGLVVERAAFRIVGTLVGAAVGFALVHLPVPPLVQLGLLASWVALGMGLTHVLRGVHGYGALLAGMTAAIVVIPSVLAAAESTDIALARVACTLIGVVVATLVLALLTPQSALDDFYARIRAVSADALDHAARTLRGGGPDEAEERRILGLVSGLEASARLASAGSVRGYRRLADVDLLVVGTLSAMAAAHALRDDGRPADPARAAGLERVAAHLRTPRADRRSDMERDPDAGGEPGTLRLEHAVGQILDADAALHRFADRPGRAAPAGRLAPHREWPLALRTGAIAGLASFAASALALAWPVPSLELAALGVCIFVMVLGSMPLPQVIAPKLFVGVLAGVAVAVFYRLAVQPGIASSAGLLLTIAPFLLAGGFARAHPRTTIAAIDANMCFLLASQAGAAGTADVARVVADAAALAATAALMAAAFMLLPRRVERQARDAADVIRRDLARILEPGASGGVDEWQARGSRQILRLTLHLGRARALGEACPRGLIAALNLGHSMLELRELGLSDEARRTLAATLRQKTAPRDAAQALRALADGDAATARTTALRTLAARLVLAEGLLTFGRPTA